MLGEQLLIRLWETLAEKGVGGLLQPWQERRVGKARTDIECERMKRIAQAEKEAEDIRAGRAPAQPLLSGPESPPSKRRIEPPVESPLLESPLEVARRQELADSLYREVNIAKAVLRAEKALQDDPQPPPEERVDPDWLYKWKQGAGEVSSETLQELWGRLLAGEVKTPSRYSLRCIDFLRNLSSRDAQEIARLGPFVVEGVLWKEPRGSNRPLVGDLMFGFLMHMQDLGILSGVEVERLGGTFKSGKPEKFVARFRSNGKTLVVTDNDPKKRFTIPYALVTELGREVLSLGTFAPDIAYLQRLGRFIAEQGFSVQLGDYEDIGNGMIQSFNLQPIAADAPQAA